MSKPYRSHDEVTAEAFRRDPAFAAEYLKSIIEDGDQAELLIAIRHIVNARGGVTSVAEQATLYAKTLYRTLSPKGNPELKSLNASLSSIGLKIGIKPVHARDK